MHKRLAALRNVAGFLAGIALPILFFAVWHANSSYYPRNDESFYFQLTQEIFLRFKDIGIWNGLSQAYLHKHWKPILHPIFGVLFIFLNGGSARGAITSALAFYDLIALGYAYAFSRAYLTAFRAALLVSTFGMIAWVFGSTATFNSELPLLACTIAGFFHLTRPQVFESKRHSCLTGIWIALGLCVRPVETALMFSLPLLVLALNSFRRGALRLIDLLFPVLAFFLMAGILVPLMLHHQEWAAATVFAMDGVLAAVSLAAYWGTRKLKLNAGFQRVFLIPILGATFWFMPGAATLYDWIFISNFGSMAVSMGNRVGGSKIAFFQDVLTRLGLVPWLLLLLGALSFLKKNGFSELKSQCSRELACLGLAFTMLCLPLLAGSLTLNGDARYYYSGTAILSLAAGVFALRSASPWPRLRFLLVLGLVAIETISQFQQCFHLGYGSQEYNETVQLVSGVAWWNVQVRAPDPLVQLHEEIVSQVGRHHLTKIDVIGLVRPGFEVADPWSLSIMSREHGLDWTFDRGVSDLPQMGDRIHWLREHYDYLLIGPMLGTSDHIFKGEGETGSYLIQNWQSKHLDPLGLRFVDVIPVTAPGGEKGELLLLATGKKRSPTRDPYH